MNGVTALTLSAMVREFVDRFRGREQCEIDYFASLDAGAAQRAAALAEDHRGKRFAHQRRLRHKDMVQGWMALQVHGASLAR